MKQGDIWYADLNPVKGGEQAGFRPVAVLSGNLLNENLPIAIVAPLTTSIKNYKGNPVLQPKKENGLKKTSEILVFHVRSIAQDRMVKQLGRIENNELALALKTLNDILTY